MPAIAIVLLVAVGVAYMLKSNELGKLVRGRVYARGVHPHLIQLLDAWDLKGTFGVHVSSNGGGLRTSLGDTTFPSNATNLADTPHGRGVALDVHPDGFDPFKPLYQQLEAQEKMRQFGEFAERMGLEWGGRWNLAFTDAQKQGLDPKGDWPHIQLQYWRDYPYPPPNYGAV